VRSRFFGKLTLGGKLTMLNAFLVVSLIPLALVLKAIGVQLSGIATFCYVFGLLFPLGMPLLWPNLSHGGITLGETIGWCLLIGANSFVWGYGLAFIIHQFRKFVGSDQ